MRNAEFDREEVLRSAMNAFMGKGYSKTSMQDLKLATGLHPGSIYCAFENKRGLMLASLEQYKKDRRSDFDAYFANDKTTLDSLKDYLDNVVSECQSNEVSKACLLHKALNEVAQQDDEIQDRIAEYLSAWELDIAEKFQLAQTQGEISENKDAAHLARCFVMGIYGLRTYAHTHPQADTLQQLANQLFDDVSRM